MEKITLKPDSPMAKFLSEMKKRKEEFSSKIDKEFPPENIRKLMGEKVKEVDELNENTLDKSTFMLGMMCMWTLLKKENLIKDETTN